MVWSVKDFRWGADQWFGQRPNRS